MYFRMTALILGVFCVGTAELSPSGMLSELSHSLSVDIPTAGLLVTAYALTVVIGGPIVTAITTHLRRKYLLVLLLVVSVAGNITCAVAPTFELLLVGRIVTAMVHGTFMAVCVVVAGNMAAQGRNGSAVAGTQLGVNLATVIGVPFGTLVAQEVDWRATFGSIAVLGLLASALILIAIPDDDGTTIRTSISDELGALVRWPVTGTMIATVLCSGGMFSLITYMVPMLTDVGGLPAMWISVVLLAYGIGSIVGNFIGGRFVDRSVEATIIWVSWTLTAVCVLYWFVAPSTAGNAIFLVLFSMATFALIPGLQVRILTNAADAPTLSLTGNMAAFALGAALGSWTGGWVISLGFGVRAVSLAAGVLCALGALLIGQVVNRSRRHSTGVPPKSHADGEETGQGKRSV
ncbi:MFS transporter [uncultured Kocuria sp.]|uniref:MFS transporter n=1 Tax=uncultured Kocuria sp. TaxID=259305 RepID=UPI002595521E|nr:MFS transporter [uncultured Kocuria sp.]MCT1367234.1 MFS transporter [Rothia sp. p3-SID1597]